ncbi:hypothetical protein D770_05100 [Flammeovirgaceae bacterium 311]|nr:hypothetical protein D770_05100 [Flammeovirgaceae bacterium 311]
MALTKVLIAVKTYPTISSKYDELVCTAGFKEDGSWIRIYPVPFRKKSYEEQYKKYDWVELDLVKNERDFRPESYRPAKLDTPFQIVGSIDTKDNWRERKKFVLNRVYTNLIHLIGEAKDRTVCTSLAVFKPKAVLDFKIEAVARDWSREKIDLLKQMNLFEQVKENGQFEVVRKLPYKFSYAIIDEDGKQSTMMVEDWEIGQLYWNCLARHEGNEAAACADVRKKYMDDFAATKDLYLFLGTTQAHHIASRNPFMIIGTFHPKPVHQLSLF